MADLQFNVPTNQLTDLLIDRLLADWLTHWLTDWVADLLSDCLIDWPNGPLLGSMYEGSHLILEAILVAFC